METLHSVLQVLQLNSSFFVYMGFFLFLLFFISRFLIKPAYNQFLYRESSTRGRLLKAEDIQRETQALREEYEKVLFEYNQKFQTALNKKKDESLQDQAVQVQQAQKQARELVLKSKQTFQKDFKAVQKELEQKAPYLARAFISKWTQ